MATAYFPVFNSNDPAMVLPWQGIPHHYDAIDKDQIRLR